MTSIDIATMKHFDFEKDVRFIFEDEAAMVGINLPQGKNLRDTLVDYTTVLNKLIPAKPRMVMICPNLLYLLCNPPFHSQKKEIEAIIKIAQNGKSLNSFLSKRALQSNSHDYMRSEWHIYHFHLSLEKDKKNPKFVKQVNALLFAYIDDDYIVFLGTENHSPNKNPNVFDDTKWLQLIHNHYPKVLEKYKSETNLFISDYNATTKNIVQIPIEKLEPQTRGTLRKKGYTLMGVTLGGVGYYNPGIGIMTSGHAMLDVQQANSICNWIIDITHQMTKYYDKICELMGVGCEKAVFKVIVPENLPGKICLCEMTTFKYALEYPQIFKDMPF